MDYRKQLLLKMINDDRTLCLSHYINWQYEHPPILVFDDISYSLQTWKNSLSIWQKIKLFFKKIINKFYKNKNNVVIIGSRKTEKRY
jgi:hypothetical protein